jgi:CHAD domain-containing protein
VSRQIKLVATSTFQLPALDEVAEGVDAETAAPQRLSAAYYDTDDLRLARWGVSLGHRSDEGWTVRLPAGGEKHLPAAQLTFPGVERRPPEEAVDVVRGFIRTAVLQRQARLQTVRRRIELRDADAQVLAEILDDEISVLDGRRIAMRFRELEVVPTDGTPSGFLDAIAGRLLMSGAAAAQVTPTVIRALGPGASGPPEVSVPELPPGAAAADAVRRAIAVSVVRLIRYDSAVRLDRDPEDLHQARVATRRLRSDLRTFRTLVDPVWATGLRDELGWLGGAFGAVRDRDVLLDRMRWRLDGLGEVSRRRAAGILSTLQAERDQAYAELLEALRGSRYLELLDALVDAANRPLVLPQADLPAKQVLPGLVRRPLIGLRRRVKAAEGRPSDEELHDVRIQVKRVRYAAEAIAPVVGRRARTLGRTATMLQQVLGDHQDAVLAAAWLRAWALTCRSVPAAYTAGEIAGRELAAAEEARARWRKAWRALDDEGAGWA